jgi:hypothetical protein
VNEIQKIEYRILELQAKLAEEPSRDILNYTDYGKGYLDALKDTLNLLKSPSKAQA